MGSPVQLVPTYFGFIESTYDALVLFEACLSGIRTHVPRRPHDREREHIIKSGNIFIYEENSSGIKRWTDGISWSPSRILGNFLIYRQLAQPFGPGEKKKANKKPKGPTGVQKNGQSSQSSRARNSVGHASSSQASSSRSRMTPEIERALIGSLVDSYDFLEDGLVKKTISVCLNGITHHLVSYYKMEDAITRKFNVPSRDPKLAGIHPRSQLTDKQNFRGPVEEADPLERLVYDGTNRYSLANQSFVQQPVPYMTPPEEQPAYQQPTRAYSGDYLASAAVSYEQPSSAFSATPTAFQAQYAPAPGIYPAPQQAEYSNADQYAHGRYSIGSNSVVSADGSRVQMPAPGEDHRRSSVSTLSSFRGSQDSGLSLHNNETHPSQAHASYYSRPRGDAGIRGIQNVSTSMTQRALPSLSQSYNFRQISYDRPADTAGHYSLDSGRENSWQMAGNSNVGHGNYQQSTGDSAGPHHAAPTGHYQQQAAGSSVAHNPTPTTQGQYQQHWPSHL